MAMGSRENEQSSLWMPTSDLPRSPGHPFFARLNALLDAHDFDRYVEDLCRRFYAPVMGRPSLQPGRYFRLLLVGYFEGIDAERGIAWRATDSLAIRSFLRLPVDEPPPDHSTISRTRRLIDLETRTAADRLCANHGGQPKRHRAPLERLIPARPRRNGGQKQVTPQNGSWRSATHAVDI
jgi:transposase